MISPGSGDFLFDFKGVLFVDGGLIGNVETPPSPLDAPIMPPPELDPPPREDLMTVSGNGAGASFRGKEPDLKKR